MSYFTLTDLKDDLRCVGFIFSGIMQVFLSFIDVLKSSIYFSSLSSLFLVNSDLPSISEIVFYDS